MSGNALPHKHQSFRFSPPFFLSLMPAITMMTAALIGVEDLSKLDELRSGKLLHNGFLRVLEQENLRSKTQTDDKNFPVDFPFLTI